MNNSILNLTQIPYAEMQKFIKMVPEYRKKYIRNSQELVDEVFSENDFQKYFDSRHISELIFDLRSKVWEKFLIEESKFNTAFLQNLHKELSTPDDIAELIITDELINNTGERLKNDLKELCGQYAGRVYPYIYALSSSNTNSRRSRAGKTFEAIIYAIYRKFNYPFDSQGKVGRKIFEEVGLGKKVDSVLPSIEAFAKRRNRTIIGTMKTSLRERWQEVAEEIERTNIPEIHLLTVDSMISKNKAEEMAKHNIVIVAYKNIAEAASLEEMKNIISFEEYFYEEIPKYLDYWNEKENN